MKFLLLNFILLYASCFGLTADFNNDGFINYADYNLFAKHWLNYNCGECRGVDLTGDGGVDLLDLELFLEEWLMADKYIENDGTTGYITVLDNASINLGTDDFSISFWIKTTDNDFQLFNKRDVAGYYLVVSGTYFNFIINDAVNEWDCAISPTSIIGGNWTHVVIIKSSSGISFYVNAVSQTLNYDTKTGSPNLDNIANLLLCTSNFTGSFDDFRLYKSVLTTSHINAIYNGGTGKKYTGSSLEGGTASVAFNFDEGVGTYTLDAVSGLLGTFTGGVTWATGGTPFSSTTASGIKEALFSKLTNDATVSGIIASRLYPQVIPQNTSLPALVYHNITSLYGHDLTQAVDLMDSRWQIDCVATTRAGADSLASAVISCLDNYSGTIGTTVISCIHVINSMDAIEEESGVDLLRRYKSIVEVRIWYKK